jgi:predicted dienelactone hydrolase
MASLTSADLVLCAAIAAYVIAWWWRSLPARRALLWLAALISLAAGLQGVLDDRWQAGAGVAAGVFFLLGAIVAGRRRPLLGSLLSLAGVAGIALPWLFPVTPLPVPTGPHAVGLRSFELVDESRRGLFGAAPGVPRRLLVRAWYPAVPVTGAQPRAYFSEQEARTTARDFGSLLGFPPLLGYLKHVRTNSFEDAPLAPGTGRLPTLFYSHGYTGYAQLNAALMEELASHGYVIYSVQHSGDASSTVFPDGSVAPMDPGLVRHMRESFEKGFPPDLIRAYSTADFSERIDAQLATAERMAAEGNRAAVESPWVWFADRRFVHDRLQAGLAPDNVKDLLAASDFSRTGELGISFGGTTSAAICMVDRRCAAAVNLDGGDFHFSTFGADLPVPLLMFHAELEGFYRMLGVEPQGELRSFNDFSYESFGHAGQRADIYRMVLKGAIHSGLTDTGLFMRRPLRDGMFGSAPDRILVGAPNAFVMGFFDHHLRGMDNGFPATQYRRYDGWVQRYDNSPVRQWWSGLPAEAREAIMARIAALKARLPPAATGVVHE